QIISRIVTGVGRRVDESSPMVDARLPDGSRVNVIIPPLAVKGASVTIRKFRRDPLQVTDLVNNATLTKEMADFLKACVNARMNIVVAGGGASGKTTTLNVLSAFIPADERIITVEDAAELQLRQVHVINLESRPSNVEGKGGVSIRDLVINTLRMRPDRIVVGEVRSGEALDMLQAMNTGHDGSLTTVHSNTPKDTISRLETLVLMAGMELPSRAIREQIASAINIIVQQNRMRDGSRRVTYISEVLGIEGDQISLQDIFVDNKVRCYACAHRCLILDGLRGICKVRYNQGGTLMVPHGYVGALQCDPTEKKPFFHAFPGSDALTFGMLGCDLHCSYCFTGDVRVATTRGSISFERLWNEFLPDLSHDPCIRRPAGSLTAIADDGGPADIRV